MSVGIKLDPWLAIHKELGVEPLPFDDRPLGTFIENYTETIPAHSAFRYFERDFSYRELNESANRLAKPTLEAMVALPDCVRAVVVAGSDDFRKPADLEMPMAESITCQTYLELIADSSPEFQQVDLPPEHICLIQYKRRDVAGLGSDGGNDVIPSGVEGSQAPLHELTVAALGMPLFDALNFDALASEALKHDRWEFLFIAAPLRVQGGTGAPINPLAVF